MGPPFRRRVAALVTGASACANVVGIAAAAKSDLEPVWEYMRGPRVPWNHYGREVAKYLEELFSEWRAAGAHAPDKVDASYEGVEGKVDFTRMLFHRADHKATVQIAQSECPVVIDGKNVEGLRYEVKCGASGDAGNKLKEFLITHHAWSDFEEDPARGVHRFTLRLLCSGPARDGPSQDLKRPFKNGKRRGGKFWEQTRRGRHLDHKLKLEEVKKICGAGAKVRLVFGPCWMWAIRREESFDMFDTESQRNLEDAYSLYKHTGALENVVQIVQLRTVDTADLTGASTVHDHSVDFNRLKVAAKGDDMMMHTLRRYQVPRGTARRRRSLPARLDDLRRRARALSLAFSVSLVATAASLLVAAVACVLASAVACPSALACCLLRGRPAAAPEAASSMVNSHSLLWRSESTTAGKSGRRGADKSPSGARPAVQELEFESNCWDNKPSVS